MNKLKKWSGTIESGVLTGSATFFATLMVLMYWQSNGFTEVEFILMSVISGVFLFIFSLFFNYTFLKPNLLKRFKKRSELSRRRSNVVLVSLLVACITYLLMDYILFLVDASIPKDYLAFINNLESNVENRIQNSYPLGLVNFITTLIFGIFAAIISLFFIKKVN